MIPPNHTAVIQQAGVRHHRCADPMKPAIAHTRSGPIRPSFSGNTPEPPTIRVVVISLRVSRTEARANWPAYYAARISALHIDQEQSSGQFSGLSGGRHSPSPQAPQSVQSKGQLLQFSGPLQVPSPQRSVQGSQTPPQSTASSPQFLALSLQCSSSEHDPAVSFPSVPA